MRGTGFGNVLAGNIAALKGQKRNEKRMSQKWKMCWKCQKDKSPVGGHIKMFTGGPMKFICRDCVNVKKEKA